MVLSLAGQSMPRDGHVYARCGPKHAGIAIAS